MPHIPAPQPLILRILYRRRAVVVMLPLLFAILAAMIMAVLPDRYDAFGLVAVMPQAEVTSLKPYAQPVMPNDSRVLSEVEIIRSNTILKKVAAKLSLPMAFISHVLDVRPVGRSYIIRVSARTDKAAVSRDIVNTVILFYQENQIAGKIQHADKKSEWLNRHLARLNKNLQDSSAQIENYRRKQGLFDNSKNDVLAEQISRLNAELIHAQAQQAAAMAKSSAMLKKNTVAAQLDSAVINALSQDETRLRQELGALQQKYGPKHPKIRSTQASLYALQSKRQQDINLLTTAISEEKYLAEIQVKTIKDQMDTLRNQQQQENTLSISLHELERQDKINRILYENFLRQSREIDLVDGLQQADSKIVSLADLPGTTAGPSRIIVIFISAFIGFLIACFVVVLGEQLRQTIDDPDRLQDLSPGSTIYPVDFRHPDPKTSFDPATLPFTQSAAPFIILVYLQDTDKAYTHLYASYLLQQLRDFGRRVQMGERKDLSNIHYRDETLIVPLSITDLPNNLGNSAHLIVREGFTSQYYLHLAVRSFAKPPEIIYLWT
jgi:uncharacterized protein involved in exopolysaccharide biosynthesis